MTYQPFLPEVGAGNIAPRNVLAPLRKILAGTKVVTGSVTSIRSADNTVVVDTEDDVQLEISYDYLVVRSEEHTSELQSRGHLVCRLLLEKKNNKERN